MQSQNVDQRKRRYRYGRKMGLSQRRRLPRWPWNAYNLVEQGVYTLEIFKSRQEKLNASVAEVKAKISENEITIAQMEQSDNAKVNLIPQTETLLASYDEMTNEERNALLKEILKKIEYKKEANGQIEIDLYPRLPQI